MRKWTPKVLGISVTITMFITLCLFEYYTLDINDIESRISEKINIYVDNRLHDHINMNFITSDLIEKHPKILIGIGCQKCGTTYFNHLLYLNSAYFENMSVAPNELHYWNECFFPYFTRKFLQ